MQFGFVKTIQKNTSAENPFVKTDSLPTLQIETNEQVKLREVEFSLALSPNALQIVNQSNGSTREIAFGMPLNQLVEILENVLKSKPSINIKASAVLVH